MRIGLVFMIILALCSGNLIAQNQCTQSLDRARALFADGHLYEIPEVLSGCLKNGFTREQRIQANHLLTLVYLYIDDHSKAEESYMNLLQLDPEFDVEKNNDKIEIVYLNSKFKTTPIFTFTARAGLNLTYPVIINDYDINKNDPEVYENRLGYWFGPGIDLSINDKFKVGAELNFRRSTFHYRSLRFDEYNIEVTQAQNFISLPVSVKYVLEKGNFYPYIYAGAVYDLLLSSTGKFKYGNPAISVSSDIEEENYRLDRMRNTVAINLMGGVGVKKRFGYHYFFIEFRFIGGLKNFVKAENRYPLNTDGYLYDFDALYKYTYIDDDMRLNSFNISLGYEKPFYKPRYANHKGFFRRIFN